MRVRRLLGAVVLVAVGVGCGDPGGEPSAAVSQELQRRVAEIRALATTQQAEAVEAKLTDLQAAVAAYVRQDEVDAAIAQQILDAAGGVRDQLVLITTTTTTPPPTTIVVPPPTPEPKEGKRKKNDDDDD